MKKICFVLNLAILFPSWSFAFTLNTTQSTQRGWTAKPLKLFLNPDNCPSGVETMLKDAMAVWNGIESSNLELEFGGNTSASLTDVQNRTAVDVPVVFCIPNLSEVAPSINPDAIPGFATGAHLDGSGALDSGYIVLNTQPGAAANISTMKSGLVKIVIAHEIGHLLGIGHSEDTTALMYFDASAKSKLGLAKDDIDAMTYLYPRDELSGDKIFGCASISGESYSKNSPLIIWFLAAPIVISLICQIRRKAKV